MCSIELRNQRVGIIERTRAMKRKLLRDFAIDYAIGGRIGGENEKATVKVESSPASFSIKADDEPLGVLANAAIEEVSTKISRYGDEDFPIELNRDEWAPLLVTERRKERHRRAMNSQI